MSREAFTQTLDLPTTETLDELEQHVQSRLTGRIRDFRLTIHRGGLILKGHTRTYHAKQLAQHAVMEAADIPIHANEIEVV